MRHCLCNRENNKVALTFDDGPYIYETRTCQSLNVHCRNAERHSEISDVLSKNGIKGTFFVNGNNCTSYSLRSILRSSANFIDLDDCIYDDRQINSLKHAYAAGHLVASHTWAHKDLTTLSFDNSKCFLWHPTLRKPLRAWGSPR